MKYRYRNSFHQPRGVDGFGRHCTYGPEFYETDTEPVAHAGAQIFKRWDQFGWVFDVVVNDVCVSQRAGMTGAMEFAEKYAEVHK